MAAPDGGLWHTKLRNITKCSQSINTNFAKLATNLVQNVEEKSSKQITRQNRNFRKKHHSSPAGNRTPVSRVTGGDTHHYTTEELDEDGGIIKNTMPSGAQLGFTTGNIRATRVSRNFDMLFIFPLSLPGWV